MGDGFITSSEFANFLPSTGEDRGKGALIFCPLTLALSRQGRENPSPGIVRRAKYFVGLKLALLLWLPALAASETSRAFSANFAFSAVDSSSSGASAAPADHQQSGAVRRFERSLARMQPLLQRYGYGAAFAAVMVEGMGIPTPGQTLLMAGALEAAQGRMSIALLLVLVTTAAAVGNSIGYAIGRWGGRRALNKLKVNPQRQQRLDDLFKRRGGVVILLARFLDVQLGSRHLLPWSRHPFHCGFFSPAPPASASAWRGRVRCLVGVLAAHKKSEQ